MIVAETEAMGAFFINVQIKGHAGAPQGRGEFEAVLDFDPFVFPSVPNKTGRRLGGDLQLVGEEADEFGIWIGAEKIILRSLVRVRPHHRHDRIAENPKVWPRTLTLDRIRRVGFA